MCWDGPLSTCLGSFDIYDTSCNLTYNYLNTERQIMPIWRPIYKFFPINQLRTWTKKSMHLKKRYVTEAKQGCLLALFDMKCINIKGAINTKRKSFLVAPSIHPRRHQRLLCRQTKPGTAGWSIHNKGSEVRAVKRLLTSHFICQTFISLFMVQCTPSAQARVHTCAWSTFKAFLPTFHDLANKRKMPDFRCDTQTDELFANNKHSVGNSGFSCSFESWIIKISDCKKRHH